MPLCSLKSIYRFPASENACVLFIDEAFSHIAIELSNRNEMMIDRLIYVQFINVSRLRHYCNSNCFRLAISGFSLYVKKDKLQQLRSCIFHFSFYVEAFLV